MEIDDIGELLNTKKRRRRVTKIKSPTDEPRSGADRSYVLVRMEDGSLEKHYQKITPSESGFFTTTAKYSPTKTARWVGGKSKNNPRFMNGADEIIGYYRATATSPGHKTYGDKVLDDLMKDGLV